jgi:hypothetical protein
MSAIRFISTQTTYLLKQFRPIFIRVPQLKRHKFLNQNVKDLSWFPHHCYCSYMKVNKYSICPLVRTAPQLLPWIRPQGLRYSSDRILHAKAITLFLFYVQVVGKFPHRHTKPGTNSLKVFMRSKYSQHVLAYLSSTENSTSLQFFILMVYNVCRGVNIDFLPIKIVELEVFPRFYASLDTFSQNYKNLFTRHSVRIK